MDYAAARDNMIEQQVRPWDVLDQSVLDILAKIPREHFLDSQYKGLAYADTRLPIGHGKETLNPNLEGRILQNLALDSSDSVLEISTGSGYLTACMASMAANVDSLDTVPEIADAARTRLKELDINNVTITTPEESNPLENGKKYNAILVCGSVNEISESIKQKLAINGRLFCFIGDESHPVHHGVLIIRVADNAWSEESLFETWVAPLAEI